MAFRTVVTDTAKQELENALERLAVEFKTELGQPTRS